jgi:hypothetical protein
MKSVGRIGLIAVIVNSFFLLAAPAVHAAPLSVSTQLHIQQCSKGYYKNSSGS